MGVGDVAKVLPVSGETDQRAIARANTGKESDEAVFIALSLVQDERARDGKVLVSGGPLAAGGEPSDVNFVPIYPSHGG